jgi:hypothetical protein
MDTDGQLTPPRRPRTSLLVLLAIVLAAAAFVTLRPSTVLPPRSSNTGRASQQTAGEKPLDPKELNVRLQQLDEAAPDVGDTERNPFRFQPKAPPPPPPSPSGMQKSGPLPTVAPPPVDPGPPPIPLKFIGVTEAPGVGKIAALTDCKHTVQGVEGDVIEGRYKIVKIGVESLIIENIDGTGRTTLRMSGQDCVAK